MEMLKNSIEVLRDIRKELHEKVGNNVLDQIDEIISNLEKSERNEKRQLSNQEIINLLGMVMYFLPTITKMIKEIADMAK